MENVIDPMGNYNPITSHTVVSLTLDLDPAGGIFGKLGTAGCSDLQRHVVYAWAHNAIVTNDDEGIGFIEIMAAVVKQLEGDFPDAFIEGRR